MIATTSAERFAFEEPRRYAGVIMINRFGELVLEERRGEDGRRSVSTFGGGVEPDESDSDAALREVQEETGVSLSKLHLVPLVCLPKFVGDDIIECQYFVYGDPVDCASLASRDGNRIVRLPLAEVTSPKVGLTPTARIALEAYIQTRKASSIQLGGGYANSGCVELYSAGRYLRVWEARMWASLFRLHCIGLRTGPPKRALDLGTGTGRFLELIQQVGHLQTTIGVDSSLAMASRAALSGHEVAVADATRLPFAPSSFDIVWTFLVWHHLRDSAAACGEASRVLASPGGQLFLRTTFADADQVPLFAYFPSARKLQVSRYPHKDRLLQDLERAGFTDIRHSRLDIPVAQTFKEYVQRVQSRSYSVLWDLPDTEYQQGLLRMQEDLRLGKDGAVLMPCDLVVASK